MQGTYKTPLSLYIHIPWCLKKCPYCDFTSLATTKKIPTKEYVDLLISDLETEIKRFDIKRKISSIYIGGGTPSLMPEKHVTLLMSKIFSKLKTQTNNIEITIEANPKTINSKQLLELKNAGINRISIGVQSFQNDKLKSLGRIHDEKSAKESIQIAKKAGFKNINIDLMFGLPNQSVENAVSDINTALSFDPTHVSWYQLTIEPNTRFYKKPPTLPDEKTIDDIQKAGHKTLKKNLNQYEVSAYSKTNFQCKHNLNYWKYGDYIGIGVSACSKITKITNNKETKITRIDKTQKLNEYLKGNFTNKIYEIDSNQRITEFAINSFRLHKPISKKLFEKRTGLNINSIQKKLEQAQKEKFLTLSDKHITITKLGKKFLNDLLCIFAN